AASADTTVLVLVPESGDAIQTLKAGVMEAADVYVINKSDRPGADKLRHDVAVMLGMRHRSPDSWEPAVLETVATTGEGIGEPGRRGGGNLAAAEERSARMSGIEKRSIYTRDDLADSDVARQLGRPGEYPFTRGIHPTMYRGRLWTMRQFSGFGTAEDTNRRFHFLLDQGQTGLSTAFDMPTLMGYDADHPRALGEVGREGVAVSSLVDMRALFDRIRLDHVTTSMTINCTASVLLAMYLAVAEEQGVPWDRLGGTIQNDMLKEFIAQKEWISPPEPSLRIVVDMIEFCAREVPRWHPVSISGYHIREAGSTAVQELAFTLADGIAYVEAAVKRGLAVDDFAPRLSFFFDLHNDFLEEVAKLR